MDLDLSTLPFLQRQAVRDLKRNHDALLREVSALVALNAALMNDLRVEREETLEVLRNRGISSADINDMFPTGDQVMRATEVYDESLHEVQREIKGLEDSLEALQTKVAEIHMIRESIEQAKLSSRPESLAILDLEDARSLGGPPVLSNDGNSRRLDDTLKDAGITGGDHTDRGEAAKPAHTNTSTNEDNIVISSASQTPSSEEVKPIIRTVDVPFRVTEVPNVSQPEIMDRFMSIAMMPEYQAYSPEELRWNDYRIDPGLSHKENTSQFWARLTVERPLLSTLSTSPSSGLVHTHRVLQEQESSSEWRYHPQNPSGSARRKGGRR